jgi:hypothetical protein
MRTTPPPLQEHGTRDKLRDNWTAANQPDPLAKVVAEGHEEYYLPSYTTCSRASHAR